MSIATGALLPWLLSAGLAAAAVEPDEDVGSTYARVRFLEQELEVERPSEGEILPASVNFALAPGDSIRTIGGRAEIELADSSVLFLDADTRLELRNLADLDNRYERTNLLALRQGAIRIDNRDTSDSDSVFQIDTEAGSIYLLSGGSIRVEAGAGETTVSSYSGVAEFSGDGGSVLVRSGQRASVAVGAVPDEPRRFNTARADEFDRFHDDRLTVWSGDHAAPEPQQVPVEVRPYVRELSYYGSWSTLAPYGLVWRPVNASAWAPYSHGAWAWSPTGWVWVSSDPWGWAPYHYGRWDYVSQIGWFWVPGRVWSGAWVSFAVSTTHVGWCPLNYWNRPVFHDVSILSQPAVPVARLDPRGWQFVPVGRFGHGALVSASRVDRLPRGTEVVVTRRLPAPLAPRTVATRTEPVPSLVDQVRRSRVALPVATTSSGEPVSFRVQEQRRPAVPAVTRAAPPRGKGPAPRPAPAGTIAPPQAPPQTMTRAPRNLQVAPPADVTISRVPHDPVPSRSSERPIPSRPQRNGPPAGSETAPQNPAVGRLVGGARSVATPPAVPPAAAPPVTAPAAGSSVAPANAQGARPGRGHAPQGTRPTNVPPPKKPEDGSSSADVEHRPQQPQHPHGKPTGKPGKPSEPDPDPSGG